MGPLYELAEFMSDGPRLLWMVPWTVAAGVVVELVCLMAQAVTARRLLAADADVAVQVLFFGARLDLDERRLTRRRIIAIALAAPAAALVLVLLGALLLADVAPGLVRDALWAMTLAAGFGVVLQLLPVSVESRDGRLWRSSARLILEEVGLLHPALPPFDPPAQVATEPLPRTDAAAVPGPPPPLWFRREEDSPAR